MKAGRRLGTLASRRTLARISWLAATMLRRSCILLDVGFNTVHGSYLQAKPLEKVREGTMHAYQLPFGSLKSPAQFTRAARWLPPAAFLSASRGRTNGKLRPQQPGTCSLQNVANIFQVGEGLKLPCFGRSRLRTFDD